MGLFSKSGATAVLPPPERIVDDASPASQPKLVTPAAVPAVAQPYVAPGAPLNPPPPIVVQPERNPYLQQMKVRIHHQLVDRLDVQNLKTLPPDVVRREVRILIRELCQEEKGLLTNSDQEKLMDEVMDETFGLGPLEILLKDSTISDILVNRFDKIYVEKRGRLELSDVTFRDNAHLRQIIDRIVALVGRR
jgi:pilus assembly protein CpaF